MTAPQPVLLLCPVLKNRHHVCQQPRNQVILLAKLTCLAGKRSELCLRMIFPLHPFYKSLKTRVLLLPLNLILWFCWNALFSAWGALGSLPWSLGFRNPQDACFEKDHVGDEGFVSSPQLEKGTADGAGVGGSEEKKSAHFLRK